MKNATLMAVLLILFMKTYAQNDSVAVAKVTPLTSFEVQPVQKIVLLKWSVAYSDDYKSFDIEREEKDGKFIKVGSKLAISKNSRDEYDFVDATPARDIALHYRLKLITKDGDISYSDPKEVKIAGAELSVLLKQNPVQSSLFLEISTPADAQAFIAIVSQAGQQLARQAFRLVAGINRLSLPVQSLLQGLYQLVVEAGNERKVISFIKE